MGGLAHRPRSRQRPCVIEHVGEFGTDSDSRGTDCHDVVRASAGMKRNERWLVVGGTIEMILGKTN